MSRWPVICDTPTSFSFDGKDTPKIGVLGRILNFTWSWDSISEALECTSLLELLPDPLLRQLRRWHSDTGKYTKPSRNTTA